MSVHQGKKLASAILAFNETQKANGKTPIERLAKTAMTRRLGAKHFDQARAYMNGLRNAAGLKIQENLDDNPRAWELNFFMMYMGLQKAGDQAAYDFYVPMAINMNVTRDLGAFRHRSMPLVISSQHTEFRFVQAGNGALDYASDDFQYAMSVGLAMAKYAPEILREIKKPGMPVILPYGKAGWLLGSAYACNPADFYHDQFFIGSMDKDGKPFSIGFNEHAKPAWSPASYISIHTFLPAVKFSDAQDALQEKLLSLLATREALEAHNILINEYINGIKSGNPRASVALTDLGIGMRKLMRSKEWIAANAASEKHTKMHMQ